MSSLQIRVCGRYRLQQKLYEGSCSSVYVGKNVQSDTDCSIKCESKTNNPGFVINEGRILQNLQGGIGIPHLIWFGENGDFRFLVTQLLGNTLEQYLDICGGKFSLKTTLMIAQKILSSMQFIHYKNYVHRDIKPANFLMGLGKKLHQIYTIDFAFATTYIDPNTRQHRLNQIDQNHFVGSLKFSSFNVLKGNRNSRRDDLQSIGFMLIYFLKGRLPWSNCQGETIKEKRKNIKKCMEETSLPKLCQGLPKQIQQYMQYVRSLRYDDIPDYNYLRRMLKQRFIKEGFQFDYIYDWILIPLKMKDTDLSNRIPLNRFTKKQDTSLSICNYQYDFTKDFQINEIKIEDIKKQVVHENIQMRTRRAMSINEGKKSAFNKPSVSLNESETEKDREKQKNKQKIKQTKSGKQDCLIF